MSDIVVAMNKGIRKLLEVLLRDEILLLSWGISDIRVKDCCICFNVNGLKYRGEVCINAEKGGYAIQIGPKKFRVMSDDITNLIDKEVEQTDNYRCDVLKCIWENL